MNATRRAPARVGAVVLSDQPAPRPRAFIWTGWINEAR